MPVVSNLRAQVGAKRLDVGENDFAQLGVNRDARKKVEVAVRVACRCWGWTWSRLSTSISGRLASWAPSFSDTRSTPVASSLYTICSWKLLRLELRGVQGIDVFSSSSPRSACCRVRRLGLSRVLGRVGQANAGVAGPQHLQKTPPGRRGSVAVVVRQFRPPCKFCRCRGRS